LRPAERTLVGPSRDFYTVGTAHDMRTEGALEFEDGHRRRYRFAWDLSKYR
jgi:hypothetical protein